MNTLQKTSDGYLAMCHVGTCPEIKQEGGLFLIRNSKTKDTVIEFTKEEVTALQDMLRQIL